MLIPCLKKMQKHLLILPGLSYQNLLVGHQKIDIFILKRSVKHMAINLQIFGVLEKCIIFAREFMAEQMTLII